MLRPAESYLSVDWLNILDSHSRQSQIEKVREILSSRLTINNSAQLAVLCISSMRDYVSQNTIDNRKLEVLHHPEGFEQSHSGIHNLSPDADIIADLIADIIEEIFPAINQTTN